MIGTEQAIGIAAQVGLVIRHVQPAVHTGDAGVGQDHSRSAQEGHLAAGGTDDALGAGNNQSETSGVLNDKVLLFQSANKHHQIEKICEV